MLMAFAMIALSVVAFRCDDDDDDMPATEENYSISGNASGNQVVPAVSGAGTGTITGTYNPNTHMLTYTHAWNNLTGAPIGGGLYHGTSGTNGPLIGTAWSFEPSATGSGTATGTMTLSETQEQQLLAGDWYYGYNTTVNPTGEVRGQIAVTQQ
jgi:hypothetical protein